MREHQSDGSHSDSMVMAQTPPTPSEPYTQPLLVPQFLTEGILRERLLELGHCPSYGCELVSFEQDLEGVTARLAGAAGEEPIRARYRAPDAPLHGAAGWPVRLFELFRGTHWTLLGYEADRARAAPRRRLHIHTIGGHMTGHASGPSGAHSRTDSRVQGCELTDAGGHFQRAYGLTPGEWVLVRPYGYVAAILDSGHLDSLEEYFTRCGL